MRLAGAQAICESLVREAVDVVFGYPGGGVIHLYHALAEYPIRHVLMRHEQAAIHAADAYARCTGRVGVCVVTSGPGATNLLTGLMTARRDSSPVVILTGQSASAVIGTDAFQEVDITGITLPVCKHNYLVTKTSDLAQVLKEAFHIALTGRPGPVVVSVAADVQSAEMDYAYPEDVDLPGYQTTAGGGKPEGNGEANGRRPRELGLRDPSRQHAESGEMGAAVKSDITLQVWRATQGCALILSDLGHNPASGIAEPAIDSGTPGSALPAAIGTQLGCPHEDVWVIERADSFEMSVKELAAIVQEHLPIKMIVLDNDSLNAGRGLCEQPGDQAIGPTRLVPDFAEIASAYGIPSSSVQQGRELMEAIAQIAVSREPMLLDVRGKLSGEQKLT